MGTVTISNGHVSPRLHLTKRGRAVFTVLAAVPLVIAAFFLATNGGSATATNQVSSVAFDYVTVHAGQTLWGLAGEIAPSADPRDVVADIVQLNQLDNANVQAGQRLAIPTKYSH